MRLSQIQLCRVLLAVVPGAAVLALVPAQRAGQPSPNHKEPQAADARLDRTPPRQTKGLRLVKLGWTYNCMECHALLPAKWHYDRPMVEHQDISLEHGENRFCLNCHHPANRNAFVDYDGAEIPEENVVLVCAKCHGPTYHDWKAGAHGRRNGYWDTAKGPQTRLRCIQCHDPHQPKFQPMAPLAPLRYPPRAPNAPGESRGGATEHVTPQSLVGPPRRGGQKTALSARAPHPTEGLPEHTPHTAQLASPGALPQHRTMGNLSATEAFPLSSTGGEGWGEEAPNKLPRPGSVLEEAVFCQWPEVVIKPESRSSPGEGTRPTGDFGFRVKTVSSPLPSPPEEERGSCTRTRIAASRSSEPSIQYPVSSIRHPASSAP